ncbi:hypothetical protein SAMN05421874_11673 [Nonomuraea maritima]|uniref:TOMM peptide n=1 Tax=Nonomuraea maritima TaxID=683260 RepID=A0A1G9HJM8_9ACTN|nr:hypothetical protein [Nonomuraea maritima]SDL13129.1 hypothetical protein SAMN05421874_11673 [Nonomuraea maritima]
MIVELVSRPAEWDLVQRRRFGELTARAWADGDLLRRYERDPRAVLTEFGVSLPPDASAPPIPDLAEDLVVEPLNGDEGLLRPCMCSLTLPCLADPQVDELS